MNLCHMKYFFLTLAIFVIVLILPHNSSAATYNSFTTITLPKDITPNTSFNAGVEVSYAGGDAFVGTLSMYHLTSHTSLGGHSGTITVRNPSITFTLQQTTTVNIIQIPIEGISASHLSYSIGINNTVTRTGTISNTDLSSMISKGSIYLALGSVQDSFSGSTSMTFNSGITYNITLVVPAGNVDIAFQKSSIYDGSKLYSDGSLSELNGYPAISFHGGSTWQESYSGGIQSINVTAISEPTVLVAYYGDGLNLFSPSFDVAIINPQSSSNSLVLSNSTGLVGSPTLLTATLNPAQSGKQIKFYLLQDNYYQYLGSSSTAANGIASLSSSFDASGTFSIQAITSTGSYLSSSALLTIDKHPMLLSNLLAAGVYNNLGLGFTTITITGKATTQSGTPLSGVQITLIHSNLTETSTNSDSSGLFSMTQVVSLTPNTYNNYYQVMSSSNNYQTLVIDLNLTITKAPPIIYYTSNNPNFGNEIVINGEITDSVLEPLALNISLDEFTQGVWNPIQQQVGSNFTFTLNRDVGTYLFRLRVDETSNYAAKIVTVDVNVNPASASLSRLGLPTSIIAEYHSSVDLSIYYLDSNQQAIDGGIVEVYVYNTQTDQMDLLTSVATVNGLASINWIPSENNLGVGNFDLPIIYTATDPNYNTTTIQIKIQFVSTQLTANLAQTSFGYGSSPTIKISTIDPYGYIGKQGTTIDVTIEGMTYHTSIDSVGEISFNHKFTTVGTSSMSLQIAGAVYPYNSTTATLSYYVKKGSYSISSPSIIETGGVSVNFNGTVTDNIGNPLSSSITISAYIYDTQWLLIGSESTSSAFSIPFANQLIKGVYDVELRITGNTFYNTSSTAITLDNEVELSQLTIVKAPSSYLVYADPSLRTMDISLNNFLGSPLVSQQVTYSINSSTPISGNLVTDTNGQVSYTLPAYLIPGFYQITLNYTGSSSYTTASVSYTFEVKGLATSNVWVQAPTNTYQGDPLTLQVQVSDTYGTLSNFPVTFVIDHQSYNTTTNAQGIASITITLRASQDTVNITVKANANGVWQSSTISTQITQLHRQLDFSMSQPQGYYGDNVYLTINTTWTSSPVSDVLVEVYYQNQLVFSGSTNSTGQLRIMMSLPSLEPGNSYLLTIVVSKLDYYPQTKDSSITVTPMPISVVFTVDPPQYNVKSGITITATDVYGNPIIGYVTLSYVDVQYTYSNTVSVSGTSTIDFEPFAAGTFIFQYLVFDYQNHIQSQSGTLEISTSKAVPVISSDFSDVNGKISLYIHVVDEYGANLSIPVQITVDGQDFTTITGSQQVTLPFGNHEITLNTSSTNVNPITVSKSIYMQTMAVSVVVPDTPIYADIPYSITMHGNGTFDGYLATVTISDGNGSVFSQNFIAVNGTISSVIPGNYLPDNYVLSVNIPTQGWFYVFDSNSSFQITKSNPEIYITPSFLYGSRNNSISLSIINGTGYAGIQVEIIGPNGTLGIGTTNVAGNVSLNFYYGYYSSLDQLTIRISGNPYLIDGDFVITVPVFITTQLDVSSSTFTFDTGGNLTITLIDGNGDPIDNGLLLIYFGNYNFENGGYDYALITTALTENGYVVVYIPFSSSNQFSSSQIIFRIEYVNNQNYLLDSKELPVTLQRDPVSLSYSIADGGVTNSYTVNFTLSSRGYLIDEPLYYELRAGNTVIQYGTISHGFLSLEENIIGSYTLYIRYSDAKSVPRYLEYSTTLPIQFEKAQTQVVLDTSSVTYGQHLNFTIIDARSGLPLTGIPVTVNLGNDTYQIVVNNGKLSFSVTLIPGIYSIMVNIQGTTLYNSFSLNTNVSINPKVKHIMIPDHIDVVVDEIIRMELSDQPNGSTYTIWFNGSEITPQWANNTFFISQHMLPGSYILTIERRNPIYQTARISVTVSVNPFSLSVAHNEDIQDGILHVTITKYQLATNSLPNNELPYPVNLTITVIDLEHNRTFVFNTLDLVLPLNDTSSIMLQITSSVYYDFQFSTLMNNDQISSQTTFPSSTNGSPQNNQPGKSYGLEIVLGLATVATIIWKLSPNIPVIWRKIHGGD